MELKNFFAQDDAGNSLSEAMCYVYQRGTEKLVEGLKKANGVALANPFSTDQLGFAEFAAPNGLYDVRLIKGARDTRIRMQFNDVAETVLAAEKAATRAETARDTFNLNIGRKADIAEGLRETVSGQSFTVLALGADDFIIEYQNNAGVALEKKRYPSALAVSGVSGRVSGLEPLVGALDIRVGKNLYNNAAHVMGGSFNTTTGGDTTPGGTWYRSEYIPVEIGNTYKFSLMAIPAAANISYAFYDASKTFISGGGSANSVIAPTGSAFLRVTFNWGGTITAVVAKDVLPGAYVAYRYELDGKDPKAPLYIAPKLLEEPLLSSGPALVKGLTGQQNFISERNASFVETPANLFDHSGRIVGKNINSTNGLEATVTGWWATGFIPVENDAATYRATTKSATINVMPQPSFSVQPVTGAWYDVDKKFIAGISNLNIFSAPAGAAYIRLSSNSASPEKIMLAKSAELPIRYEQYRLSVALQRVQQVLPPYWGKKWCALGDSFTQLNLYAAKLCDVTGLQQTKNFGVSGELLRTMANQIVTGALDDIDVVTLLGGTNNYGHGNAGLGTIADTKDTMSIYGDVRFLIDKILTVKPTVRLYFFTPTNRGAFGGEPVPPAQNTYGLTIQSIGRAMMEVCREMGVPCFDLGGNSGINSYTLPIYTTDNLHPNQIGADIIGTQMARFINSHGAAVSQ